MKPEMVCPGVWGRIYWNGDYHSTGAESQCDQTGGQGQQLEGGNATRRMGGRVGVEGCMCDIKVNLVNLGRP